MKMKVVFEGEVDLDPAVCIFSYYGDEDDKPDINGCQWLALPAKDRENWTLCSIPKVVQDVVPNSRFAAVTTWNGEIVFVG